MLRDPASQPSCSGLATGPHPRLTHYNLLYLKSHLQSALLREREADCGDAFEGVFAARRCETERFFSKKIATPEDASPQAAAKLLRNRHIRRVIITLRFHECRLGRLH